MDALFVTIYSSGLNEMILAGRRYSKRTPKLAVDTAAFFVAWRAHDATPFTTPGAIDTELGVTVMVKVGPRGGKSKVNKFGLSTRQTENRSIPYAMLIVLARMNKAGLHRGAGESWTGGGISNYNMITGNRYALPSNTTGSLQSIANRMTKSRRSSTKFIRSGWIPALQILEREVPRYARRGTGKSMSSTTTGKNIGTATPANPNGETATTSIENMIGLSGQNSVLDQRRNDALWRVAAPILQWAIDVEAEVQMRYVAEKEFEAQFAPLKYSGITVNV